MKINLKGQRFGSLVVIEEIGRAKDGSIIWGCKCDCGESDLCPVVGGDLRRGRKLNCGCMHGNRKDLVGKKFGKLTVVSLVRDQLNNTSLWLCKCECENKEGILVKTSDLTSGSVSSCGCLKSPSLVGQIFGKLLVIEKLLEMKHNYYLWKCLCECGEFVKVTTQDLNGGRKKSCGCLEHEYEDLTDSKFGRLTVVQVSMHRNKKGEILWECKCDCGNEKVVPVSRQKLIKGHTRSCGCLKQEFKGANHTNYKNGVTPISKKVRKSIKEWNKASLERYGYKCIISGRGGKLVIHHNNEQYPFYILLENTFIELNIKKEPNIGDYTDKQLELIQAKCLELHFKAGLGIPMKKKYHKEFHETYGFVGWTEENFRQFVKHKRQELLVLDEIY